MGAVETFRSVVRFRKLELRATKRRLSGVANVEDLRAIAKRRLPGGVFDYIDGAAEDEVTYRRNESAFQDLEFVPRVLRDVSQIDTRTEIMGQQLPIPLILAPTGFTRMFDSDGELAVARAAERAGLPYSLSSLSTRSIEEVRAVSNGDLWFQVYTWRDRALLREMLDRSKEQNYSTIVLTIDNPVIGRRERDVRRGFELPPKIGLDTVVQGALHPAWTINFLRAEPIKFANVKGQAFGDGTDPVTLSDYVNKQFDPKLSWDDLAWFREHWDGNLILKGIQSVADATLAVKAGVEVIALSNHGGRQLDGAPAVVNLIEPVRQAVGDGCQIICDGGVRRGSDILKAIALGADGCMIGRPYLYALGAAGEAGVDHVLNFFETGLRRTMALSGCRSIAEVDRSLVEWI